MRIKTTSGVTADVTTHGEYGQPSVTLTDVPGIAGNHTYNAAQFLLAKALGENFTIASHWIDTPDFTLSGGDIDVIVSKIKQIAGAKVGNFEMTWVPADKSMPF